MINNIYARAYTEVLEIIKYFPEEEYVKIPIEKINLYKSNMDKNYIFSINPEIDLSRQNISAEAKAIMVTLFRDYYATEEQKKLICEILELNQEKAEEEKRKKYNPDKIFEKDNQNVENEVQIPNNTMQLVEYKETFFTKFKKFIQNLIKRKDTN